ncbi:MAG TPA: RCC1 repeat-containing protein, partial [Firmicutes bacterium]|nr:RCC1 repeat-containing protein [Bacillota bacterium]
VGAGGSHTFAVKNNGTVWACGRNEFGQLGDGTTTDRHTPVQVNGLSNVKAITGGNTHTVALTNDGAVWTWGRNDCGQLGDGTET